MRYIKDPLKYGIEVNLTDLTPQLSEKEVFEIDQLWVEKSKQSHLWHNGMNLSCREFSFDGENIRITLGKVDYKTYTWIRQSGKYRTGGFTLGTEVIIFDNSLQKYVFSVRSTKVGFDQGKISLIGGVTSYPSNPSDFNNFFDYLSKHIEQELSEEVIFNKILNAVTPVGIFFDPDTYKVDVAFIVTLDTVRLNEDESIELIYVSKDELNDFIVKNKERFSLYSYNHLNGVFLQTNP